MLILVGLLSCTGTPGSRHSQRIAELGESHDDLSVSSAGAARIPGRLDLRGRPRSTRALCGVVRLHRKRSFRKSKPCSTSWTTTPTDMFLVRLLPLAEDSSAGWLLMCDVGLLCVVFLGDELAVAMRQAEPSITDGQIDRVMKALDTDGSGSISSTEFRSVLGSVSQYPNLHLVLSPQRSIWRPLVNIGATAQST